MPNNYAKMSQEQLRKVYDYNNKYSKENYKNLIVKLDRRRDGELIEFLKTVPDKSKLIRDFLFNYMKSHK